MKRPELLLYLLFAIAAVAPAGGEALGAGVDLPGTLWFQHWILHCLLNFENPGFTDLFFTPDGKDILAHTGNNFVDALIAAPLLALLGPPHQTVALGAIILLGNGLSMDRLLGALGLDRPARLAGGLFFAAHPFVANELSQGRPTQALLWFWPLALAELLGETRRPALAGVLVGLQAWTYWFTGHFFLIAFALPLLGVLWGRWREIAAAAGAALATVAPGLLMMGWKATQGGVPGLTGGASEFGLISLALHSWFPLDPWTTHFPQPWRTVIVSGLALVAARRHRLWIPAALLALGVAAGPSVRLSFGEVGNPFWGAASLLPGFYRLLFPYRALSVVALVGAVALGEALERLPRWRWPAAGLVLGLALPWPEIAHTPADPPSWIPTVAAAPGPVLDLPYPCSESVIWLQPLHGQPLIGGMAARANALRPGAVDERFSRDPLLSTVTAMAAGRPGPPPGKGESAARWVILHAAAYEAGGSCWTGQGLPVDTAGRRLTQLLGPPTFEADGAMGWDLGATGRWR